MLANIRNFIKSHCDFKVYTCTIVAVMAALAVAPCIWFMPEKYGYENGLLENLQMLTLLTAFIFAIKAKVNRKFFNFVAMVVVILAIREVNCGRTIFFPVPGEVNEFYRWKDIKYGWLAHPLYGLYMAYVAIYFLKNKLFITLWDLIKNIKLPVWNIVLMLAGMILGTYAEEVAHNMVFEEITELLFYVALTGIIWLYAFNKEFQLTKED